MNPKDAMERSEKRLKKFKRYPEYRDSGVEWLGEIPAHWEVRRLKNACQINPETLEETADPDYTIKYIDISNVHEIAGIGQPQEICFADAPSRARRIIRSGDTILSTVRTYLKAVAFFETVPANTIASTGFAVLRPTPGLLGEYLHYFVLGREFIETVVVNSVGVAYPSISPHELSSLPIWMPPSEEEQRAITAFVDRETARIDALIAKKERLIELLQEKRTALITHAVTKGLDPDVPMKDSGVEWLGEIPAHWGLLRLKFLAAEPLKYGANETAELNDPELPRYIRITDINEDGSLRGDTFRSLPEHVAIPYLLKEGDLLFARSGATVGKSFRYMDTRGRAAYAGYLIRARLKMERVNPRFVEFFAQSKCYWNWLSSAFIQATIQNVSAEKYANLSVPTPSLEEQCQIVNFIESKCEAFDRLLAIIRNSIKYFKEYRTALISAAVTGKIDVRDRV